ncbi:helix-turn-helix transcriptional regulator [Nocardiaceae bacterium YC2-7]|uniref:Helix-turn-helix transcriptional regulator n=1 Tax=Antrihabitans stalactiti TaxID=2584121 RepID=A0A848KDJ8_9NOCA|nr:helix-turn-helix transcriptional regulator [Antrihabitans stalactiti]
MVATEERAHGRAVTEVFELLGKRWQLRIIWELRTGAATFRELQQRCDGVSPSVLAARLQELRDAAIIEHDDGYRLTAAGDDLLTVYQPISDWTRKWRSPEP